MSQCYRDVPGLPQLNFQLEPHLHLLICVCVFVSKSLLATAISKLENIKEVFCWFQGIRARVLETFVMLFLLGLLILGIVWVASALIDNDAASMESLYGISFNPPPVAMYVCMHVM